MLGVPFMLNSSVDPYSAVDAAATATNRVLFVGDWKNYVILDRIGTSVHYLPPGVLTNTANNLPDGRVGWFAVWRTGAEPLSISAFRMLDVATTA
jgi:predicted phage gp36 major capsid-like protein